MVTHTPLSGQSALVLQARVHIAEVSPLIRLRKVIHRGVDTLHASLALHTPYDVLLDELHAAINNKIGASRGMADPGNLYHNGAPGSDSVGGRGLP